MDRSIGAQGPGGTLAQAKIDNSASTPSQDKAILFVCLICEIKVFWDVFCAADGSVISPVSRSALSATLNQKVTDGAI